MDDAIRATADYHDGLVREFIILSNHVRVFDHQTNAMVDNYVQALERQMITNSMVHHRNRPAFSIGCYQFRLS